MNKENKRVCAVCGCSLKYYDSVLRVVRSKGGHAEYVRVQRFGCAHCGTIHRELPDFIFPYKQYDADIIRGVIEGFITPETMGYEDYPCEMTMLRWRTQNSQLL